jgi:hypothetical protein
MNSEVFRIINFDKNKNYSFALYTSSIGIYPEKVRYYTTNKLQFLGKYIKSERWGWHDGRGGAEYFDNSGVVTRIEYDYDGKTCFTEE